MYTIIRQVTSHSLEDVVKVLDHLTPEKLEEVGKRVEDTL